MKRVEYLGLTHREVERFIEMLTRSETGCLLWNGPVNHGGYGSIRWLPRRVLSHCVAWWITGQRVPQGYHLAHNCPGGDNKRCCNPSHLRCLTAAEHGSDSALKGQMHKSRQGLPFGVRRHGRGFAAQASTPQNENVYLGTYDSIEEAAAVAMAAKTSLRSGA